MSVDECWEKACSVTGEWVYDPSSPLRLQQKHLEERTVPLKHMTLAETLDPQPQASVVIRDSLLRSYGLDWRAGDPARRLGRAALLGGPKR